MKTIETIQTVETTITRIPVKNLLISPLNVRKKQGTGIEELAALIASQGLIHNLVVTPQLKKGKQTGKQEVVAGGRRLAALNLLIAEGRLSKDHEVDCRLVGRQEALEISLSENSGREHMHPADLVMAYRNLTDAGFSPDEIAPRFGVSPLTVRRYLKLANVSPKIFALYAEGRINFEQISALALTDDHELQERLWEHTSEWQRNGATFRRLITGNEINIRTNPLAKFVGVEAYEAAGGLIRRDLFGNEDEGYMQDAELLESLALEKLNQAVESVKEEGFAWVQVRTQCDYSDLAEFGRARTVRREPTEEEKARMDALTAQMEAVEAEYEAYDEGTDESGEVYAGLEEKHERVQWELDRLGESMEQFSPDDLAVAGAIVTVGHDGELKIERGFIRKEDMKKFPSREGERGGAIAGTGKGSEEKPVHSEKLTRMLTAHRTAAIQAAMANKPDIALATLVHQLVLKVFSSRHAETPVKISIEQARLKADAGNIEQGRAVITLEEKRQYWQERIEAAGQEGKELFVWLLDQSQQDLLELLAFCTATSISTVSGRENAPSKEIGALMTALNLDMADWWEATGENYLSYVSKDRILTIVAEAVSPQHAQSMNGFKKGDLVWHAEQALSGLRWLPDNLKAVQPQEEQDS